MKWQPDGNAPLAKIGVLTPHVDHVPESEMQAMAPAGVSIHGARVFLGVSDEQGQMISIIGPKAVRAYAEPPRIDEATKLLAGTTLDAIVHAFTTFFMYFGNY